MSHLFKKITLAIVGGICGALLAVSLSERIMNVITCVLLILALVVTLKKKEWTELPVRTQYKTHRLWQVFFIAMYDGGFGPGSSTFSILHYLRSHQTYIQAVQLTRVLIFGSCTGDLLFFTILALFNDTMRLSWQLAQS